MSLDSFDKIEAVVKELATGAAIIARLDDEATPDQIASDVLCHWKAVRRTEGLDERVGR